MASGTKLVYTFTDSDGRKVQYSYNHANPQATATQVKAVATALITNTAVLARTLVTVDKVVQIVTAESQYDISDLALATRRTPEIIDGNPEPPEADENTAVTVTKIS